jgi:hypothetical protein
MAFIKYSDAPQDVRKLALAVMESTGLHELLERPPSVLLAISKAVGLDAAACIAALRWVGNHYAEPEKEGSILDRTPNPAIAKSFDEYAAALESYAGVPSRQ